MKTCLLTHTSRYSFCVPPTSSAPVNTHSARVSRRPPGKHRVTCIMCPSPRAYHLLSQVIESGTLMLDNAVLLGIDLDPRLNLVFPTPSWY